MRLEELLQTLKAMNVDLQSLVSLEIDGLRFGLGTVSQDQGEIVLSVAEATEEENT